MRKGESIGNGDIPRKRLYSCPWNECNSIGCLAISSGEADWLLNGRNLCSFNGPPYDVIIIIPIIILIIIIIIVIIIIIIVIIVVIIKIKVILLLI